MDEEVMAMAMALSALIFIIILTIGIIATDAYRCNIIAKEMKTECRYSPIIGCRIFTDGVYMPLENLRKLD